MAINEHARGMRTQRQVASADLETLLTSVTAKSFVHNLTVHHDTESPLVQVVYERNIKVANALDPLSEVPLGWVIGGIRRRMDSLSDEQLDQIDRMSAGVLNRNNSAMSLPERHVNNLKKLGKQARRKLQPPQR